MRYKAFRIQNFKGIKDTTVSLGTDGPASIFAFVGLNESGKTTILEAIHSFSPDRATSELVGGDDDSGVPYAERVPRHEISSFTGKISVTATVALTDDDKKSIFDRLKEDEITVDIANIPNEIEFERWQKFAGGDFVENYFSLRTPVQVKTGKQRKWRLPKGAEERKSVRQAFYGLTPDIELVPVCETGG